MDTTEIVLNRFACYTHVRNERAIL